ncbi:hypothetical protein [Pseudomonas cremoricolorata]|uniref:hypothetical protein n=1 Tax=Pseudomonas cremoricolorata TaxID=157783 RepID=UPI00067EB090|nr:hypothetical protein [Pseudomonas cremoricolorata]
MSAAEGRAEGVEYMQWVPGKTHFRCDKLSATMSTTDCASRHAQATAGDERMLACRFCPIGAVHAGKDDPLQAASASAKVRIVGRPDNEDRCTRCGRGGLRLIHSGGEICVSCWNRQREWRIGKNAKGTAPKTFTPLRTRRVGLIVDGEPCYRLVPDTQNDAEPLAKSIRELPEGLAFHDEQPGITTWNEQAQRFEYRDRSDPTRVMLELIVDGMLHYVSAEADSVQPGDVIAAPTMPTMMASVHVAAIWLALDEDGDGAQVSTEWRPQPFVCSDCGIAQVRARRFAGWVECRCPACASSTKSAVVA